MNAASGTISSNSTSSLALRQGSYIGFITPLRRSWCLSMSRACSSPPRSTRLAPWRAHQRPQASELNAPPLSLTTVRGAPNARNHPRVNYVITVRGSLSLTTHAYENRVASSIPRDIVYLSRNNKSNYTRSLNSVLVEGQALGLSPAD